MNVPLIIAMGGGANQGAAVLISWAAGLSVVGLSAVAYRMKKKLLSVFAAMASVTAFAASAMVAHLFGWWPGHIISAAIILLPLVLEVYALTLSLQRKEPNQ